MAAKKIDGLYKRGRIYWASRDPVTGQRNVSTKCTDVEAARLWLRHRERLAADPAYKGSLDATFGEWSDTFLKSKRGKSEATREFNATKVKAILTVIPRETPLADITPGFVDHYVETRLAAPQPRPPHAYTVAREVRIIISTLAKAKRSGCYPGDLEALMPTDLEGRYTPRERSLTPEEVVAFVQALPTMRWKALAAVCVALGCRLSEACRLAPEDVDLDAGLVWIDGRKTSTSDRTLPVLSPYLPLLTFALSALPIGEISNVDRTFKLACARAEIARLSPNDLRRTHATLNGVMGLPDDMIARLLGHATVSMAKRTYNRTKAAQLAPVAERLLAQGTPVHIPGAMLQSSYSPPTNAPKEPDSGDEYQPSKPVVAGSNPAGRATNTGENWAPGDTGRYEETRPWPGRAAILLQSEVLADLAPLSPAELRSRRLRPASADDHTIVFAGRTQWPARARLDLGMGL